MSVLSVRGLTHSIGDRVLLQGVGLDVAAGESVAVTGPSGSGKSTLLGCVLGLVRPDAGGIEVAGADLTRMRGRTLERHRSRNIGVVFQFGELLPELTPAENVALAALLAGVGADEAYRRAGELLDELRVPHGQTPTAHLSGGERQRTAVARALVNEPKLLLADEPTGALDERTRDSVADLLFSVPGRWGCGLVVVTHDLTVAARADRRLDLRGGRLVTVGDEPGVTG
ncbi:ABC transporter ATP-binding protein [Streptomyces poonensis]|uniref:ABC transporter ATP-binding protein n=1 Tax=Streptomyces poonensis TaxID=68255 RepID=UPI001E5B4DED|nr:ABC transporter ATP-binding protein [Streptomyces poonensis]